VKLHYCELVSNVKLHYCELVSNVKRHYYELVSNVKLHYCELVSNVKLHYYELVGNVKLGDAKVRINVKSLFYLKSGFADSREKTALKKSCCFREELEASYLSIEDLSGTKDPSTAETGPPAGFFSNFTCMPQNTNVKRSGITFNGAVMRV